MEAPENIIEIFLQPGEHFFGDHTTRLRTILGSCVSIVFWHPILKVGGMSHIMLPSRPSTKISDFGMSLDGKYADEAIELLIQEMEKLGTKRKEYQVKIFGGGNMFPRHQFKKNDLIGNKNVEAAKKILLANGFKIEVEHLGGKGHRYIIFDVWSGDVWLRFVQHGMHAN